MSQNNSFGLLHTEDIVAEQFTWNSDLNVDSSNYFTAAEPFKISEEWFRLNDAENYLADIVTDGPFTITPGLKYAPFMDIEDDLNIAKVILGIKDNHKLYRLCIAFGLCKGRLFIGDIVDSIIVNKEKLVEGVKLVLSVAPLKNGKSIAILSIIDECNLLLARLKSNKILFADWKGKISPGAHFKSLCIDGNVKPEDRES